jgi:uncharacterized RDD family membrane protein YckC
MSTTTTPYETPGRLFDPAVRPELFDGVRSRRIMGFLVDAAVVLFLMVLASLVILVMGIFTLGLGWLLFPLVWPVVAIIYTVFTLGGRSSATPGMRFMGLEMRTLDGAAMTPLLALLHALGFWFSIGILTPLILLVSLFSSRKRLLHDIVIGTVVIRDTA